MQAITTKFIGPTNHRGARVRARCEARTIYVYWEHGLGVEENHRRAAEILAKQLGWKGCWVGGSLPDGSGDCFVCVHRSIGLEFTIAREEDAFETIP